MLTGINATFGNLGTVTVTTGTLSGSGGNFVVRAIYEVTGKDPSKFKAGDPDPALVAQFPKAWELLRSIHALKRELIFLRRAVWPCREVMSSLERSESSLVQGATKLYIRDVYDHVVQILDTIEALREMVTGMLDIYLSSISYRLNAVMKVLTVITTIFMPLTFIVGIYGMNFQYMPELESRWGYPAVLLVMVSIAASMLIFFKRKKWL